MTKVNIDGLEIEVPPDYTLLQACEEAGAEVPRFCFHERLSIAGNCRMCLVEVKGVPKPMTSCALAVKDLRPGPNGEAPEVSTKSKMVKRAREGALEFLLANHPLDCPICDQGGECDLQDQAMAYGIGSNRFEENKRAVEDKNMGPLVKTVMTRCIHCTRCMRFITEIAGIPEIGLIGRGEDAEITTYLEASLTSELQGNIIDLCPVGALTSKPYAFTARAWELAKTETVDVMDAVGSAIRVDSRGRDVMRILPRLNEVVNEEWISDKSRFIWDGLKVQRLDKPYVRKDGRLTAASWGEAFAAVAARAKGTAADRIGAIAGDVSSVEEMFALKDLVTRLGSANVDCRQDGSRLDPALGRASYIFNSTIFGIEDADVVLLVGANPRLEATIINARIRKNYYRGRLKVGVIGEAADLTYAYDYIGAGPESLAEIAEGRHPFADVLKNASHPMIIVGQGALCRPDGAAVLSLAARAAVNVGALKDGWNGFNVLHTAAARVGGLDLGFVPGEGGKDVAAMTSGGVDLLFLHAADEIDMAAIPASTFVVYIGSHGDAGAHRADVILPGAAYTETTGTYVNTEGRVQRGSRAVFPPGEAREDWAVLRALSEALGQKLPYDSLAALRTALVAAHPAMAGLDDIAAGDAADVSALADRGGNVDGKAFAGVIDDYYRTNPVTRASAVMADLSRRASERRAAAAAE
ncbi:MAG: NADH-quinone oxidoreductase subunit NuoG [Hyphomicrobiales bacterium]